MTVVLLVITYNELNLFLYCLANSQTKQFYKQMKLTFFSLETRVHLQHTNAKLKVEIVKKKWS